MSKRVAIINSSRCKPTECNFECGRICPVNQQRKECLSVVDIEDLLTPGQDGRPKSRRTAKVIEASCIGCGLCAKPLEHGGCPFGAVSIVNIPTEIRGDLIHTYLPSGFRLYRMPIMKKGKVMGLIGQNGIGKSTIVRILAGKLVPNFGMEAKDKSKDPLAYFAGTEMHRYMTGLPDYKVSVKAQRVDAIIAYLKAQGKEALTVSEYLRGRDGEVINSLDLGPLLDSTVVSLSGGELQRVLCARTLMSESHVYIFDEPTNYLDVRQRLNMARLIAKLSRPDNYVLVIEHDLSILDYVCDYVSILYGTPSAYGVCSRPLSTAHGINTYFSGYIQEENMRFRQEEYSVSLSVAEETELQYKDGTLSYNSADVTYENPGQGQGQAFRLHIEAGQFPIEGALCVVMGRNGTGKTTFVNHVASDLGACSYKRQYLETERYRKADGSYPSVLEYLHNNIDMSGTFATDVIRPLNMEALYGNSVGSLSGGELQRFAITVCLGTPAHIYLLDEPSACLDIEQRVLLTKVIKRFVLHNKKVAFVVEHDMMMAVALGGEPGALSINTVPEDSGDRDRDFIVKAPVPFREGLNMFLGALDVTFRTQKAIRPRINKYGSTNDREQKAAGTYYL